MKRQKIAKDDVVIVGARLLGTYLRGTDVRQTAEAIRVDMIHLLFGGML
jgi:hypothetical protein